MALEKQTAIDKIEILEDGTIQIRKITRILENGIELSHYYWRTTITPDKEDLSEFDSDPRIQSITNVLWTKEVKDAFIDKQTKKGLLK